MTKIKVTKELANAINHLLYREGAVYTKESLLSTHARMNVNERQWNSEVAVLNNLNALELAELLLNGYEVKLTPEEEVLELLNESKRKSKDRIEDESYRDYWEAFSDGVSEAVRILGFNTNLKNT